MVKKSKFKIGILYPYLAYPSFRILITLITAPIFYYMGSQGVNSISLISRITWISIPFLVGVYSIELFPKFKPPIKLSMGKKIAVYMTYILSVILFELYLF